MAINVSALYSEHWQEVYRFLRRRVADHETAENLAADVFLRVVQAVDRYEDRGAPSAAWLFRIAKNLLIDHYRERHVETAEVEAADAPGGRATVDAGSDRQIDQIVIAEALMRIALRQRIVLVEEYLMDATLSDTALVMGCSESNVKKLRRVAHYRLGQILLKETA